VWFIGAEGVGKSSVLKIINDSGAPDFISKF